MPADEAIQRLLDVVSPNDALHRRGRRPIQRYPRPPKLRKICSVSCSYPPEVFFKLVQDEGVRAVVDLRPVREYSRAGWTDGRSIRNVVETSGLKYFWLKEILPTKSMLQKFGQEFEIEHDLYAWTRLLEAYEDLWISRQPAASGLLRNVILYGEWAAVAFICRCMNHCDCHRALATGIIANLIPGLQLKVLATEEQRSSRAYPRRYLFHDFQSAGLTADVPIGIKEQHAHRL